MLFQFEHRDLDCQPGAGKWALKPLHLPDLKHAMQRWQDALHGRGWNSLYLGNHDQPRPVSRWGDDGRWRVHSAKMLATWLDGQQGTPYVYPGEELGMTNTPFARIEDGRDIESINHYRAALERGQQPDEVMTAIRAKGRDNARKPMPWGTRPQEGPHVVNHAGFTTGTPWLALNPNFDQINAAQARADADSVFHPYRQLIQLRRQHPVWVQGRSLSLRAEHPQIAAYRRVWQGQQLLVVCNFSADAQQFAVQVQMQMQMPDMPNMPNMPNMPERGWQLLLGNWPVGLAESHLSGLPAFELRPYEARVYLGNSA